MRAALAALGLSAKVLRVRWIGGGGMRMREVSALSGGAPRGTMMAGERDRSRFVPIRAATTVLNVLGMRNNSCRERVADALGRVQGVKEATVSLIRARAIVVHEPTCEPAELVRAVQSAGYVATPAGVSDAW